MSGLKSCPFCGGKCGPCDCDENCTRIQCPDCGAEILWTPDSYELNVLSFNTRHPSPEVEAMATALRLVDGGLGKYGEVNTNTRNKIKQALADFKQSKE